LSWSGVQMIHYAIHVNLLVVSVGTTRPLQHSLVTVRINLKILNAHHHHRHLVNQQVCPLFFLDTMIGYIEIAEI
jgi:hypothetical protein